MYIYSVLLSGFKSFPSRTIIKLHPGLTAIIGPNGAGKSNIVDGILWAMGEGRGSILRTDTMGDVIFKGSKTRAPLARAEVQLVFVEGDESVTIGRRVYRNGESEFLIDGRIVRLRDVQDKLWEIGVEAREYVVIEQGQVEQLLSMSSEERMVFLEAAAGVRKYKERRREALRKVWDIEKELSVIRMREAELEENHEKLLAQLKVLNEYRRLTMEIEEYYSTLLFKRWKRLQERIENLHRENETIDGKIEDLRRDKEKLLVEAKNLSIERADVLETMNALETERSLLKNKETTLKPKIFDLRDRVTGAKEKLRFLIQRDREIEERISSINRNISRIKKEREKEKENYGKLSAELKRLENELKEEEEKAQILKKNYLSLLSSLKEKQTILQQEKRRQEERENRIETLELEKSRVEEQLESLNNRVELKPFEENVEVLRKRKEAIGEEIQNMKNKISVLRDRETQLRRTLRVIENTLKGQSLPELEIEIKQEYADIAEILWEREMRSTPLKDTSNLNPGFYLIPRQWEKEEFSRISGARINLRDALWRENLEDAVKAWEKTGKPVAFPQGVIFPEGVLRIKGEERGLLSLKMEMEKVNRELEETVKEKKSVKEKLLSMEKDFRSLKESLKKAEEELLRLNREQQQRKEKEVKLTERLHSIKTELEALRNEPELSISEEEIEKLNEKLQEAKLKSEEEERILSAVRDKTGKKRTELAISNEKIVRAEKELERLSRNLESARREKEKNQAKISHLRKTIEEDSSELERIEFEADEIRTNLEELEEKIRKFLDRSQELEKSISKVERRLNSIRRKEEELRSRATDIEVEMAQINEKLLHLRQEAREKTGKGIEELQLFNELSEDELEEGIKERERAIEALEDVNFAAEREEKEIREKMEFIRTQRQDLEDAIVRAKEAASEMEKIYRERIRETFEKLSSQFSGLFASVVEDGEGNIFISDKGLEIEARFTGKKKQPLSMLSGGEKALLSLIFYISLFKIKPAPFLILDEVDAPLDIPNLTKLLKLLEELKRETQIIAITHNISTARRADYIYGVSMPEDGTSRVYSVSARELFHNDME